MNLLDTSPDRICAAEIQRLQMEAEQLAAYALKHCQRGNAVEVVLQVRRI